MTAFEMGHRPNGNAVRIDMDRLIESRLLLTANSGGGKTWAIRRLLEKSHGLAQQIVIDVEGEYSTLRQKFDYVLAARNGGDTLADVRTAELLAKRLLELNVSAIIDIYELHARDRILFVRKFVDSLVNAPKKLWHPALIVIDEAHVFAPQHGDAESSSAVIDLMTRGRKRGFCGVLATQRLSKLHKDAAAEANLKLIGRSSMDIDMRRSAEELGLVERTDRESLRGLAPGEFYAFGPGLSNEVIRFRVGDVVTTHPRPGQREVQIPAPREKVKAILAQLADLPKEAEEEAKTAAELRAKVRTLELDLKKARAGHPDDSASLKELRDKVKQATSHSQQLQRELDQRLAKSLEFADKFGVEHEKVRKLLVAWKDWLPKKSDTQLPSFSSGASFKIECPKVRTEVKRTAQRMADAFDLRTTTTLELTRPQQRILDALAWLEAAGVRPASRTQAAFMAGVSPSSSGYANNLSALSSRKLLSYPSGGRVELTDAGRDIAAHPTEPPSSEQFQEKVLALLSKPQAAILRPLIEEHPTAIDRESLAGLAGVSPSSSGYANNLSRLRSLGLIDYVAGRGVLAQSVFFIG